MANTPGPRDEKGRPPVDVIIDLENLAVGVQISEKPASGCCPRLKSKDRRDGRSWVNWMNLVAYIITLVLTYAFMGAYGLTHQAVSEKYQTLITPKGYAIIIWVWIFLWEGLWALWQLCPPAAGSSASRCIAPWWWSACFFQCMWVVAFAQESVQFASVSMLCVLGNLIGVIASLDTIAFEPLDYYLLRAPFALHLGWIICTSIVHINMWLDWARVPPATALAVAIASCVAMVLISGLAVSPLTRTAEPIIGLVAAWALIAAGIELADPALLSDPARHNAHAWPEETITNVRLGAFAAASLSLVTAALGIARRERSCCYY